MDIKIKENREDTDRHGTYFETFAQAIALITENINMQMEAEYADVYDRSLMGLYANKDEPPSFMDHTTRKRDITHYLKTPASISPERDPSSNLRPDPGSAKVNYQDQREAALTELSS